MLEDVDVLGSRLLCQLSHKMTARPRLKRGVIFICLFILCQPSQVFFVPGSVLSGQSVRPSAFGSLTKSRRSVLLRRLARKKDEEADSNGREKGKMDKYAEFLQVAKQDGVEAALVFAMGRMPKRFCQQAPQMRAAAEFAQDPRDKYAEFLLIAAQEGVDDALQFAATCMSEDFCKHNSQLRVAAEFVQEHGLPEALKTESMEKAEPVAAVAMPATQAAEVDRTAPQRVTAALKVCDKCVKRLQKKTDSSFDVVQALQQLIDQPEQGVQGRMVVQTVGCLKMCKKGPTVELFVGDRHAAVVRGMTHEETASGCFHGVKDERAVQRVFKLSRLALDQASAGISAQSDGSAVAPAPSSDAGKLDTASSAGSGDAERARRSRLRASMESRVSDITKDLDVSKGSGPALPLDEEI